MMMVFSALLAEGGGPCPPSFTLFYPLHSGYFAPSTARLAIATCTLLILCIEKTKIYAAEFFQIYSSFNLFRMKLQIKYI
jgi:hypothetical protein